MKPSEREIRNIVTYLINSPVPWTSRLPESRYYIYTRTLDTITQRGYERPNILILRRIVETELVKYKTHSKFKRL